MTITRHSIDATMQVSPYYVLADTPAFIDTFQSAIGWTVGTFTTLTRTFNDTTARFEMAQVSTDGGFPQTSDCSRTITGLTVGKVYRVVAHAYGVAGADVNCWMESGVSVGAGTSLTASPQEVVVLMTATSTTATLTLRTNTYSGSSATFWQDVAVYQVTSTRDLDLKPTRASVAFDDSWSPFIRASITCPIPSKDALDKVDPRKPNRVTLTMTQADHDTLLASDLTAMLAATGTNRTNLVSSPRGSAWSAASWATQPLTGANGSYINGVSGGARCIATGSTINPVFTSGGSVTVSAGSYYQASVYVRCSVVASLTLSLVGPQTFTGPATDLAAGVWNRVTLNTPTPVAATGDFAAAITMNGTFPTDTILDISQAMVEAVEPTAVITTSTRTNLCINPSGEGVSAVGWAFSGCSSVNSSFVPPFSGSKYLRMDASSTATFFGGISAAIPVAAGTSYAYSGYVLTTQGARQARIEAVFSVNADGTGATTTVTSAAVTLTGTWQRISVTGTTPVGYAGVKVRFAATTTGVAGDTLAVDAVLAEHGTTTVGDYFDGDTPGASWTGTAGNSTSTLSTVLATAFPEVGDYFDGSIGRVGNPRGFPDWTGLPNASTSEKVFGPITTAKQLTSMFGSAVRTNLMPNPSFETNTTGWGSYPGLTLSRVTTGGQQGVAFARGTVSAAGLVRLPIIASRVLTTGTGSVTVSAWIKGTAGRKGALQAMRATASTAGTLTGPSPVYVTLTGSWQRVSVTLTVSTPAPWVEVSVQLAPASGTLTVGDTIDADGFLMEQSPSLGTYFDGSIVTAGWTNAWTGTAHASTSTAVLTAGAVSPASYLTDLFGEQYNQGFDSALNVTRTLNLGLRDRTLDYVNGTMTLTLTSDEMLLQDYGRPNGSDEYDPPSTTGLKTLVNWALNLANLGVLEPGSSTFTIDPTEVIWNRGESLWSFLDAYIQDSGLRLWCDEQRKWWLLPAFTGSLGTVVISGLTSLDDVLSREDWGDAILLANEWTDLGTGTTATKYAYSTGGLGNNLTKLFVRTKISKATPTSTGAASVLSRVKGRGRKVGATGVSNYGVTPGLTALISTPATTLPSVLVSAVTFDFPDDEMTVTTRDLP